MAEQETSSPPTGATATAHGSRYQVVEENGDRIVVCDGSPNVRVYVVRGLSVTEEDREDFPKQTIFLDGAFSGPPFLDNETRQYSLDHHAGGVPRPFLMATCEQAAIMVLEGLPLEEGEWRVYLNDPDLDAVLGAWVIINHATIHKKNSVALYRAMPVIRVEGHIDAHGLDMPAFTGLPRPLYEQYVGQIHDLRGEELALKAAGEWGHADWATYTKNLFDRLDGMLIGSGDWEALTAIKELGRISLGENKIALLCRSGQDIYSLEERLEERFGDKIAIIVLDAGGGRYTVRLVDQFLRKDLNALYGALNAADPNARESDLWGGSGDIGGSPRKSGAGLSGEEILGIVKQVHGAKESLWQRMLSAVKP